MLNMMQGLDNTLTLNQMENRLLILRSEGFNFSSSFSNFAATLKSSMSNFTEFFLYIGTFDGNNKTAEAVAKLLSKTESRIERMNYVVLGDTALPCPDGFKDNFTGYVAALNEERVALISQVLGTVEEFNTYLASFIGDKNSKIALKDDHKKFQALKVAREAQVKKFQSFFTSGVNQRQYLNKMFANKSDLLTAGHTAVDLWRNVRAINPKDLEGRCQMISQRLQMVLDMKDSSAQADVSKQALLNLAEGSYEVARQVEHLAHYMTRCEIASVTTGNILERLDNILK